MSARLALALALALPQAETPGTADAALARIAALARGGDPQAALALAERWLEGADERALGERERAELAFARGVLLVGRGEREPALAAFGTARALAGPGELRLDATYDLGVLHLLAGEEARARIPEIAGTPASSPGAGAAPPAGAAPAGAAPGAAAQEEDPLAEARAAYLRARELLVERLRAAWRDADTRANLELVQRRLRELDEIERQREEQQQEEQQQDESEDPQEGEDGEKGEQDQDQQSQQDERKDPEREERQDSDSEQKPPQDESEGEEREEPPPPEPQGEDQEGQSEPQAAPPPKGAPEERHLTQEEVVRLLDKLAELEEQAQRLRELLREKSRIPVERDW